MQVYTKLIHGPLPHRTAGLSGIRHKTARDCESECVPRYMNRENHQTPTLSLNSVRVQVVSFKVCIHCACYNVKTVSHCSKENCNADSLTLPKNPRNPEGYPCLRDPKTIFDLIGRYQQMFRSHTCSQPTSARTKGCSQPSALVCLTDHVGAGDEPCGRLLAWNQVGPSSVYPVQVVWNSP